MPLPDLLLSPVTELDAVNAMLLSIGQSPVNTLEVNPIKDVAFARLQLHNTSREVQTRGWWFNRERGVPLYPDADTGYIMVDQSILDIDCEDQNIELVQRGEKLYDMANHTFTVARTDLKFGIITFLPWTDLPQVARNYIATRAARIFQSQQVGSDILYRYDSQLESEMHAPLQAAQLRNKDTNILASGARTNIIYHRRRRS